MAYGLKRKRKRKRNTQKKISEHCMIEQLYIK
jgi:hypothetical protein